MTHFALKSRNSFDIDDVFESIYNKIISHVRESLGKGSGQITNSVIEHNINISKYDPLAGSSYKKITEIIRPYKKGLAKIRNIDDNECFKWYLVRYFHPEDHNLKRIKKADKDFARKLNFKVIKFLAKDRDMHKLEKRIQSTLVFLVMKTRKNIQYMYQKNVVKTSHY